MNGRIIGHMVVRNELHRHLRGTVYQLLRQVNQLAVYDDRSDDGTYECLSRLGLLKRDDRLLLGRRPEHEPSFLDDESVFRQAAWEFMEAAAEPTADDWILCLDADEFLVSNHRFMRCETIGSLTNESAGPRSAFTFHVAEVFDILKDCVDVRVDGFWGQIEACRFVRWQPHGRFAPRRQGGGSVPAGWADDATILTDPFIAHYGYCTEEDRRTKYERYRRTAGHNPVHIESILTSPVLHRMYL